MINEFVGYVAAAYPILWIDTHEYNRAIKEYARALSEKNLHHDITVWDVVSGISKYENNKFIKLEDSDDDPSMPIEFLHKAIGSTVMFVKDYHLFIESVHAWRALVNDIDDFKQKSKIFVIVSPKVNIPEEIKRYVTVINFSLPTKDELKSILDVAVTAEGAEVEDEALVLSSGSGLTAFEFENAIYHSIVLNKGKIIPQYIHEHKRQLIRKNSAMDIVKPEFGFERIIGLDNMKEFVPKMVGKKSAKGILIVGIPGGGKSAFAKALGKETNRMTISLDIGNLQGGIVGETEQNTKDALLAVDAMQPAILFLDEIDKSLAGVGNSYSGDSGTSKRQGGQILEWLQDHTSDVYVVATCNDISALPPEYLRAGRWNAIFSVGLPTEAERKGMLDLYKGIYNINDDSNINIDKWTGAEIENLCKLASNLDCTLADAQKYVCPMIKVSEDKINKMLEDLSGIAVPATKFVKQEVSVNSAQRSIHSIA